MGCPGAAGHLSLLRACGRLQEAAKPAGREERAPWSLCSLWESGVSQMAGRARDEVKTPQVGGGMAGPVPWSWATRYWPALQSLQKVRTC